MHTKLQSPCLLNQFKKRTQLLEQFGQQMTPFWKYYFVFAYLHFLKNWPWFYSIALQCSLNPQYILTQHVLDDFGVISKTDRSQQNWTVCILNSVLSVKHQIMLDTNIYFHWCESPFSQVNFKKNIFAYHFKPRRFTYDKFSWNYY